MIYLFLAMIRKIFLEAKFYLFNTLSYIITLYLIFLLVFTGTKFLIMGGESLASSVPIEDFIIGFMIWGSTIDAYSLLAQSLFVEARLGTLEQLYMIPFGFECVATAMILANFIYSFIIQGILLILMMLTTGRFLHIDLISIIPLWFVTILGVYGLGFAIAGISLIYKRVQASYQIMQFLFAFLITLPIQRHPILKFLPLGNGYNLIKYVMGSGERLWNLPIKNLLILIISSLFYLAFGYIIYKIFEDKARDIGALAHY